MAVSVGSRGVIPLAGAAPYIGGKRNLAKRIIQRIEAIRHECYAEPFVGMGGVFFRRRSAPRLEVINDRSNDVATFFRVLQRHYVAFVEMLRFQLTVRAEFERLVATDPDTLTDLERAARFYYLQRTCFGGKVSGRNFGVAPSRSATFDVTRLIPELEQLHARLAGVVIERLPYDEFIARYDREYTLFYLDPPYWRSEADYGRALFSRDNFEQLAAQLASIKGQFVLSINDVPEIRRAFTRFSIEAVQTTYTVGGGSQSKAAGELLITN